MTYNLLITTRPMLSGGRVPNFVSVSTTTAKFDTYEAAETACEQLKEVYAKETQMEIRYLRLYKKA